MTIKYALSDVRMRQPSGGTEEVEGGPVTYPITSGAWLTAKGRKALDALAKRGELLRFASYAYPLAQEKGGYAIRTGDPNQKAFEELRSLLGGSWTAGAPNAAKRIAEKKLLVLGREDADELAPLVISAANKYQYQHLVGTHDAGTYRKKFEYMTGLVEMARHGEKAKLARLGWGPGWSGVVDAQTGLALDEGVLPGLSVPKRRRTVQRSASRPRERGTPTSLGGVR